LLPGVYPEVSKGERAFLLSHNTTDRFTPRR